MCAPPAPKSGPFVTWSPCFLLPEETPGRSHVSPRFPPVSTSLALCSPTSHHPGRCPSSQMLCHPRLGTHKACPRCSHADALPVTAPTTENTPHPPGAQVSAPSPGPAACRPGPGTLPRPPSLLSPGHPPLTGSPEASISASRCWSGLHAGPTAARRTRGLTAGLGYLFTLPSSLILTFSCGNFHTCTQGGSIV